jgi:hypothetical protein
MLGGASDEVVVDRLLAPGEHDVATLAAHLTAVWTRTLRA